MSSRSSSPKPKIESRETMLLKMENASTVHEIRVLQNAFRVPFLGNEHYQIEILDEHSGKPITFFADPDDASVLLVPVGGQNKTLYRVYDIEHDFAAKIEYRQGIGYTCEIGDNEFAFARKLAISRRTSRSWADED